MYKYVSTEEFEPTVVVGALLVVLMVVLFSVLDVVAVGVIVIVYPDQRVASQILRWLIMLAEVESITEDASVGWEINMKLLVMVEYVPVVLTVAVVVDGVTEHPSAV
jgi:hypothetical protein